MPVAPEDHDDGVVVHAANADPLDAVNMRKEIRNHHKDIGILHRIQIAVGPGAALMHGREGACKVFEPLGEVFAAGYAREQGGVPVSGEILVSAQVDFRARAGKRGGIRTMPYCRAGASRMPGRMW